MPPVAGVRLAAVAAGVRYPDRLDLVLLELAPGSRVAAVFTRNRFRAAPVQLAEQHLAAVAPRYLLINTGNANAGTGAAGLDAARRCCAAVAARAGCDPRAVLPFSTGVIGEPLPVSPIEAALPAAFNGLAEDAWLAAARGIMTTDTVPKGASLELRLPAGRVRLTGIAKGAGMIRPDMATMLAFIATDATIDAGHLRALLRDAVAASFNRITVDGDTSTNDACVLMATGRSGVSVDAAAEPAFAAALTELCQSLAQAMVRDGEGATRFVTVVVEQGRNGAECLQVAYAVAQSPLVKTALFAGDPNWGRILAAVGRAGIEDLAVTAVDIWLNDVRIVHGGERDPDYTEAQGQAAMAGEDIRIRIALGRGEAMERVWTTDLSHEYIRINAEYRT